MNKSTLWMTSLAVPLFVGAYLSTRGTDGNLGLFFQINGTVAILYMLLCLVAFRSPLQPAFAGHALLFGGASIAGMIIGPPKLDEMAGMLFLFIATAAVLSVAAGFLAVAVKRLIAGKKVKKGTFYFNWKSRMSPLIRSAA